MRAVGRTLRMLLGLLAGLGALTGCGVGPEERPRLAGIDIDDRSVPLGPATTLDGDRPVPFTSTVYLASSDGRLVPVARELTAADDPDAQLRALFRALVDGPTDAELNDGLRSLVPPTTEVLATELVGTRVVVDLSADFASIGGEAELLAVGQLALTATTFPGAQSLELLLEGTPTAIPLPGGALTSEPVTLREFSSLLDPIEPITTTTVSTTPATAPDQGDEAS